MGAGGRKLFCHPFFFGGGRGSEKYPVRLRGGGGGGGRKRFGDSNENVPQPLPLSPAPNPNLTINDWSLIY